MIEIKNIQIGFKDNFIIDNLSFDIKEKELIFISGNSGSGKTTLLNAIKRITPLYSGEIAYNNISSDEISLVSQINEIKSKQNLFDGYYQQRFNSEYSEDSLVLRDYLGEHPQLDYYLELFELKHLENQHLIKFSNGQQKRVQILKAILTNPKILLIDALFVGLDVKSKKIIEKVLLDLNLTVIATGDRKPDFFTKEIKLKLIQNNNEIKEINYNLKSDKYEIIFKLENLKIRYQNKNILENISWTVCQGERWLLRGRNGAGKTTILSVINGDHPQAYSNKIILFDKLRGTGESIWDIKRKISFFSPEIHTYFDYQATVYFTIASGLFDSVGVSKQISVEDENKINYWLLTLNLTKYKNSRLISLSKGTQRLVLLVRTLIKEASVIILDEPCQGLDRDQTEKVVRLIDNICKNMNITLVYVSHEEYDLPKSINKYFDL